mmetsp:Transcript_16201/g.61406  ORF Transcript_16201/g.61406 Transcript_16201/m.61406 type:complete len:334 (-) Transcript_16201:325-1326(-)
MRRGVQATDRAVMGNLSNTQPSPRRRASTSSAVRSVSNVQASASRSAAASKLAPLGTRPASQSPSSSLAAVRSAADAVAMRSHSASASAFAPLDRSSSASACLMPCFARNAVASSRLTSLSRASTAHSSAALPVRVSARQSAVSKASLARAESHAGSCCCLRCRRNSATIAMASRSSEVSGTAAESASSPRLRPRPAAARRCSAAISAAPHTSSSRKGCKSRRELRPPAARPPSAAAARCCSRTARMMASIPAAPAPPAELTANGTRSASPSPSGSAAAAGDRVPSTTPASSSADSTLPAKLNPAGCSAPGKSDVTSRGSIPLRHRCRSAASN